MPKICYRPKEFNEAHMVKILKANEIIEEYKAQGFELTLRQLYYQFVSRDLIGNNMREYKNLGNIINEGRLAGLIDWDAIVDRTRNLSELPHWADPSNIISACASQFRIDKWDRQPRRIEVWIEKDALVGVIEKVCQDLQVAFFSCRGYTSQSEMWSAAMRLKEYASQDKKPLVLHFGDHDPSGIDMTRDIRSRLEEFAGHDIELRRLALNMPQIEEYNPPPNPVKLTDSRCEGYKKEHGDESWELDALEPRVLATLIRDEIMGERDADLWAQAVEEEEEHKRLLGVVSRKWDEITEDL